MHSLLLGYEPPDLITVRSVQNGCSHSDKSVGLACQQALRGALVAGQEKKG